MRINVVLDPVPVRVDVRMRPVAELSAGPCV
jgi:hypothetical protein